MVSTLDSSSSDLGSSTGRGHCAVQPRPQSLLGVQNGGAKKTLVNSRSRVSKNIGDFDCFKMAAGSRLANFLVT